VIKVVFLNCECKGKTLETKCKTELSNFYI
jgi:hypothetical protein